MFHRVLVGLVAALLSVGAMAAEPVSSQAALSWVAPTQNIDNTPITVPLTYRVYRNAVRITETSALSYLDANPPRGQQCYFVTAVAEGSFESAPSNTACKTIRFAAPTDGAIE